MARPVIDIQVLGVKELGQALARFEPRIQKKVVRRALRESGKRLKDKALVNWSGGVVTERTGRTVAAMEAERVKPVRTRRGIRFEWAMPTKAALGIEDDSYYPFAIEYGYTRTKRAPVVVPAKAPIRRAVNSNMAREHAAMGKEIGKGIEREAKRHFAKVKGPK